MYGHGEGADEGHPDGDVYAIANDDAEDAYQIANKRLSTSTNKSGF